MNPKHYLSIFCLLVGISSFAQNISYVHSIGNDEASAANAVCMDSLGNSYVIGAFRDQVDFDPGPSTVNLNSTGLSDVYMAKYDSSGAIAVGKKDGWFILGFWTGIYH